MDIQTQHIYRMLLECKTEEQIARELNISTRTVRRYVARINKQYGQLQKQKTEDNLYTECKFFKDRMLKLYSRLETIVNDDKRSGTEISKCAETASNILVNVLRVEGEGIKAVLQNGLIKYNGNYIAQTERLLFNSESERQSTDGSESADTTIITSTESDSNRKF